MTINPTDRGTPGGLGQPLRFPPPPPRSLGRPLHLVSLPETEPLAAGGGGCDPQRPATAGSANAAGMSDQPLAAANRRLERELAEMQDEVGALQEMLEELPAIFERKFQARLQQLLDHQRRLQGDNGALRQKLLAIAPGSDQDPLPLRPRGLLPPAIRTALKMRAEAAADSSDLSDAGPTRAGSADPTRR